MNPVVIGLIVEVGVALGAIIVLGLKYGFTRGKK